MLLEKKISSCHIISSYKGFFPVPPFRLTGNCQLKEHNHVFAHAQEFDFWTGGREFRDGGMVVESFINPFASSSINFGFTLKLLRIKDQWCTVLVECQFVCNQDLSLLTSLPLDGTSSGGKCYSAGQRRLSPGSFQKGSENREKT